MHEIKPSKVAGYGLLEMLIALGLSGLLLAGVVRVMGSFLKSHKNIDLKDERFSVIQAIRYGVDCKAASFPKTCLADDPLDIPGKDGDILILKNSSSTMRGWTLRAICKAPNKVEVKAARFKSDGSFAEDPLSNKKFDWEHSAALLIPAGTLCPIPQAIKSVDPKIVFGVDCYIVEGVKTAQCSSPGIEPPPCDPGYESIGVGLDEFGSPGHLPTVEGWRKIRYCGLE